MNELILFYWDIIQSTDAQVKYTVVLHYSPCSQVLSTTGIMF